MHVHRNGDLK